MNPKTSSATEGVGIAEFLFTEWLYLAFKRIEYGVSIFEIN